MSADVYRIGAGLQLDEVVVRPTAQESNSTMSDSRRILIVSLMLETASS